MIAGIQFLFFFLFIHGANFCFLLFISTVKFSNVGAFFFSVGSGVYSPQNKVGLPALIFGALSDHVEAMCCHELSLQKKEKVFQFRREFAYKIAELSYFIHMYHMYRKIKDYSKRIIG